MLAIFPVPKPLNSPGDNLAGNIIVSPPEQLVCIYENSLAAGILKDIIFSTKKNRKEEIHAEEFGWVSTPTVKTEFVPEFTSGKNSPAVLGRQEVGNIPSLHFCRLELGVRWVC